MERASSPPRYVFPSLHSPRSHPQYLAAMIDGQAGTETLVNARGVHAMEVLCLTESTTDCSRYTYLDLNNVRPGTATAPRTSILPNWAEVGCIGSCSCTTLPTTFELYLGSLNPVAVTQQFNEALLYGVFVYPPRCAGVRPNPDHQRAST